MWQKCPVGLLSSVLYWSGGWGLLDTYFLPSQVNLIILSWSQPKYQSSWNKILHKIFKQIISMFLSCWQAWWYQQWWASWAWSWQGQAGPYIYEMSNYKKGKQANITNICRSLHGGLSRDGREDEAYPLQPYYFLALIPWQYDHLDEEYAWNCDFPKRSALN